MLNSILAIVLLIFSVLILVSGIIGCALFTWALIQMEKGDKDNESKDE